MRLRSKRIISFTFGLVLVGVVAAFGQSSTKVVTPESLLSDYAQGSFDDPKPLWLDSHRIVFSAERWRLPFCSDAKEKSHLTKSTPKSKQESWIARLDIESGSCNLIGKGSYPKPSPDGAYIAYVAGIKNPRLWVLRLKDGKARPITATNLSNSYGEWIAADEYYRFNWSNDSKKLAYSFRPEATTATNKSHKKEQAPSAMVANTPTALPPDTELWVYDIQSETQKKLVAGSYDIYDDPSWAPDGTAIIYAAVGGFGTTADKTFGEVRRVTYPGGSVETLIKDAGVQRLRPSMSPDGKYLGFTNDPNNIMYPAVWNIAIQSQQTKNEVKQLTHDLFISSGPAWCADSSCVYFRAKKGVFDQIYRLTLNGELKQITTGARDVRTMSISPGGERIAWSIRDAAGHKQLYTADKDGSGARVIADFSPDLPKVATSPVEEIYWKLKDGTEIAGLLIKPLSYKAGTRSPLIVDVHGGPIGGVGLAGSILMMTPMEWQMWAAKGYAVLVPDYRSSGLYGWSKITEGIDQQDFNERDFHDVMTGVDEIINRGIADPDRLGMIGHSYGGVVTNWVITHTSRFKVAISYEGASEWYLAYGVGLLVGGQPHIEWTFKGKPWDVPQNYRKNSAVEFVKGMTTPTLFVVGEKGVPAYHSEFLYTALRQQGIETQLVTYGGEGHVVMRYENQRDLLDRAVRWIDRHLNTAQTADSK